MRKKVDAILKYFVITLMVILLLDVIWQVISRFFNEFLVSQFKISIPNYLYTFTDELAGFLLIWVGLAGAAYTTGLKQHLSIDLISVKLSERNRRKLAMSINIIISLFALTVLIIGGIWLVYTRFYLGQVSASLQISLGWVYLILPISGFLIIYYCLDDIINTSRS